MKRKNGAVIWFAGTLTAVFLILAVFAGICIWVDPFFHYHKPLNKYNYITAFRYYYTNDGIIRNYDYEGVIAGTSMADNFKTSEAEELFGVGKFIKISMDGTGFVERTQQLERVYHRGKTPKYVIRTLDDAAIKLPSDKTKRDFSEFDYLYNDNIFDDVNYLFNLSIFMQNTCEVLGSPLPDGEQPIDFDKYLAWYYPTGKEAVLKTYVIDGSNAEEAVFTAEDRERIIQNISCNITDLAYKHPETTFICFFPPYSICEWDKLKGEKTLNWTVEAQRTAAEEILDCPNIKLFGFSDNYDMTCNLDNYKDLDHYDADINSYLLKMMSEGTGQLNKDNYQEYFDEIRRFYGEYDYTWLHE